MIIKYEVLYNRNSKVFNFLQEAIDFYEIYQRLGYEVKLFQIEYSLYDLKKTLLYESSKDEVVNIKVDDFNF